MKQVCSIIEDVIKVTVIIILTAVICIAVGCVILWSDHLLEPLFIEPACSMDIKHKEEVCEGVNIVFHVVLPTFIIFLDLYTVIKNKEHMLKILRDRILDVRIFSSP